MLRIWGLALHFFCLLRIRGLALHFSQTSVRGIEGGSEGGRQACMRAKGEEGRQGRQAGRAGREGRQTRMQAGKDAGRQAGQDPQNLPPITINKSQKHGEAPVFVFLGS